MKTSNTAITLGLVMLFSNSVFASSSDAESASTAMLTFMGCAALALSITYFVWRVNNNKRRSLPPKVVNRGPVKRMTPVYYRKKEIKETAKV